MDILWILVILLLLGAFGTTPLVWSHGYGWGPSGGIGLVVVILVIVLLMQRR